MGRGDREGSSKEVSLGWNLKVRRSQQRKEWKGSRWGDQHEGPRAYPGTEREGMVDSKSGLGGEEP